LTVIEDAAQAHAARYKGLRVGGLGDLACFSFYPSKNLGAYGEGGMVVTTNPTYADTIRMLRDWGQERKYRHVLKGYNYRMAGLQGAILRVKLRHLEHWTKARRSHAARYDQLLVDSGVQCPTSMPYAYHVYHVYTVRTLFRDALRGELQQRGIQTGVHYPIPVHLQEAYAELGHQPHDLRVSEQAASEVLSLPMYPELSEEQLVTVSTAVRDSLSAMDGARL
jgi:dTDP-4-amino-4,6-dideoxygalactose transaminase